jgi:hypothetical protein
MNLEPRFVEKNQILFHELDDFTEIIFFNKGAIDLGFEINKKRYYVLRK